MQNVNLCKEVLENAIGVHETCEKCGMETQPLDVVAVQAMKDLLQYRQIGTVEEFRAAVEKQTAKKIFKREATDEDTENELREFITRKGMIFQCPTCGSYIAVSEMKNCWDCGQKLDWSGADAEH